jgi:hypothetical protein
MTKPDIEGIVKEIDPVVRQALAIMNGVLLPDAPRRRTNIRYHDHPPDPFCTFCLCPECCLPFGDGYNHDHDN